MKTNSLELREAESVQSMGMSSIRTGIDCGCFIFGWFLLFRFLADRNGGKKQIQGMRTFLATDGRQME